MVDVVSPALRLALVLAFVGSIGDPHREEPGENLIGAWESQPGKVIRYDSDGTGTNPDGSRFKWQLREGTLIAQRVSPDGEVGPPVELPIAFTKDRKEYRLTFGDQRVTFSKLGPDGRRYSDRTEEDRAYPPEVAADQENEPKSYAAPTVPPEPAREPGGIAFEREGAVIRIGPNIHVSTAHPDVFHAEVTLAAAPGDPDMLLAGSMFDPLDDPAAPKIVVYASRDGGKSWEPSLERLGAAPEAYHDPALAFAADGSAYVVDYLFPTLAAPAEDWSIGISRTRDGGRSWGPTTRVLGPHDRPFLEVDRTGGAFQGRLYCNTATGLFVSTDGGASLRLAKSWTEKAGHVGFSSANPVVLSDGTLVAPHGSVASEDQAESPPLDYLAIGRSVDGGETFGREHKVADLPRVKVLKYSNVPSLAVDGSNSAHKDRVYAVWLGNDAGGNSGVMFSCSADGGVTWGEPVLLSEQDEVLPDVARDAPTFDAFLPTIAVNNEGMVGVAWYDTRGVPRGQTGWNYRFRASLDGGSSWLRSIRASERTTLDARGAGHTAGLSAGADGAFHLLWIDGRTGQQQVWTARADVVPMP